MMKMISKYIPHCTTWTRALIIYILSDPFFPVFWAVAFPVPAFFFVFFLVFLLALLPLLPLLDTVSCFGFFNFPSSGTRSFISGGSPNSLSSISKIMLRRSISLSIRSIDIDIDIDILVGGAVNWVGGGLNGGGVNRVGAGDVVVGLGVPAGVVGPGVVAGAVGLGVPAGIVGLGVIGVGVGGRVGVGARGQRSGDGG